MPDFAEALGATKGASTLLVLFIPSRDRDDEPIDRGYWVREAPTALGTPFGGATAFPQGKGVWRDDARGGTLLFDEPVVIRCYTGEGAIEGRAAELRAFLDRMGREARQGAIGLVIDREYLEIGFPPEEPARPRRPRGRKRRWSGAEGDFGRPFAESLRSPRLLREVLTVLLVESVPDEFGMSQRTVHVDPSQGV